MGRQARPLGSAVTSIQLSAVSSQHSTEQGRAEQDKHMTRHQILTIAVAFLAGVILTVIVMLILERMFETLY